MHRIKWLIRRRKLAFVSRTDVLDGSLHVFTCKRTSVGLTGTQCPVNLTDGHLRLRIAHAYFAWAFAFMMYHLQILNLRSGDRI